MRGKLSTSSIPKKSTIQLRFFVFGHTSKPWVPNENSTQLRRFICILCLSKRFRSGRNSNLKKGTFNFFGKSGQILVIFAVLKNENAIFWTYLQDPSPDMA